MAFLGNGEGRMVTENGKLLVSDFESDNNFLVKKTHSCGALTTVRR